MRGTDRTRRDIAVLSGTFVVRIPTISLELRLT